MVTAVLWTGGKDSVLAMIEAMDEGHDVQYLVTFGPENPSFKAHPLPLMQRQAAAVGKPHLLRTIGAPYAERYEDNLRALRDEFGVTCIVTGDIDFLGTSTTNFIQARCEAIGLASYFPLWKRSREELLAKLLQKGLYVVFSCVKSIPFEPAVEWLGQPINDKAVERLRQLEENGKPIDICGENGEYHTMVLDGPCFSHRISLPKFSVAAQDGLSYMQFTEDW
ncbi:unnamed protein product [Aphanomyces euteiches]|uniref:Diphthine--ammonia ligase n=1 Tax=Aphanomyces euteiches TaxID=100861 RepID=A0A6G0WKW4_9STRA|nr:hypothetical protein Ae201684_014160 [Aphanomyces euteiches]KAH9096277.1 hypothetical protein Ae201684P_009511 [Aphanomyces euteiches]KAH9143032.1 hypothetical protein AeRB84_012941 [Aphanomyces euteiches]